MKVLEGKSYGSIGHLPGSRRGPADRGVNDGQHRIACVRARDRKDRVIVQEKLDGSNVGVVKKGGQVIAVGRSGFSADSSPYEQHILFARYVSHRKAMFDAALREGERICGEWLALAHGTVYDLPHEPFVAFDLFRDGARLSFDEFAGIVVPLGFVIPKTLSDGPPCGIERADELLGEFGHHGAKDRAEGCVWRVERDGSVDYLAKYVRADKVDGKYFAETHGRDVWNTWKGWNP